VAERDYRGGGGQDLDLRILHHQVHLPSEAEELLLLGSFFRPPTPAVAVRPRHREAADLVVEGGEGIALTVAERSRLDAVLEGLPGRDLASHGRWPAGKRKACETQTSI
jgi:hypothetical protein